MNLINHYWVFSKALTPKFCNHVRRYGNMTQKQMGITGETGEKHKDLNQQDIKNIQKKRDSNIVWMNDPWIYKEIKPYIALANKNAGWNYDLDFSEPCQFTEYKPGQYYGWHSDDLTKPFNDKNDVNKFGKIRKLSVTCSLSDPSEYQGGELEFDFRTYDPNLRDESKHVTQCNEVLPKGSIVVFPSFIWHRVKPVIRGIRHSLVIWNLGYPYK